MVSHTEPGNYIRIAEYCDIITDPQFSEIDDVIELQTKLTNVLNKVRRDRLEGRKKATKGSERGFRKFFEKIIDESPQLRNTEAQKAIDNIKEKKGLAIDETTEAGLRDVINVERDVVGQMGIDTYRTIIERLREARTIKEHQRIRSIVRDTPLSPAPKERLVGFIDERITEIREELKTAEEISRRTAELSLSEIQRISRERTVEKLDIPEESREELEAGLAERKEELLEMSRGFRDSLKEAMGIPEPERRFEAVDRIKAEIEVSTLGPISKTALREQAEVAREGL